MAAKGYFLTVDIARFAAAALIAATCHYTAIFGAEPHGSVALLHFLYAKAGYLVEFFFLVSGFFMYRQYRQRIAEGEVSFAAFLKKRVLRIYPLMMLTCLMAFIPQNIHLALYGTPAVLAPDMRNSLLALLLSCLGLQSGFFVGDDSLTPNGASWFISVLMVCYIIFFALVKACRGSRAGENAGFVLLCILGIFLYMHPLDLPFLFGVSGRGYLSFFLGCLMSQGFCSLGGRRAIALGCMGMLAYIAGYRFDLLGNDILMFALLFSPSLLLFTLALPLSPGERAAACIRLLGKLSFSVFMWNIPLYAWAALLDRYLGLGLDHGSLKNLLCLNAAILLVSIAGYYLFERRWDKSAKG
ncbi:MAG: acyltransferase [Selenomonas ruminantium]|nr:acyltransferase [Selenomonas ruminantium]